MKLPEGWNDYTAQAAELPAVVEMKRRAAQEKTHLEVAVFGDQTGAELTITYLTIKGGAPTRSVIEDMLETARSKLQELGPEISYTVAWDPKLAISTQKLRTAGSMTVKGYVGFGLSGTLLSVYVRCSGNATACDAALAGVAIDRTRFHPLDSLDEVGDEPVGRIGKIVGGVSMMALFALLAIRRRRKLAAAG